MVEYLLGFEKYCQLIDLICLVLCVIIVRKKTGFLIVLSLSCLLGFSQVGWEIYLTQLKNDGIDIGLIRNLWYMGFALSDFIFVAVCIWMCDKWRLPLDKVSNYILVTFIVLGFAQAVRYFDRLIIETDQLGWLYSQIVPALNLGVSVAVVWFTTRIIKELTLSAIKGIK